MTWPPPHPVENLGSTQAWDPKHPLDPKLKAESNKLLYIVVDEIIEEWVGLSVSVWPEADSEGRLRFIDPQGPVEISTTKKALQDLLRGAPTTQETPPEELVRVGATFGARVKEQDAAILLESLRERANRGDARVDEFVPLVEGPVDLTEKGREAAKLAHFGAMLPVVRKEVVEDSE